MIMNKPYKPIACELHDEYESAIMRKNQLTIKWLDDKGEQHKASVLPNDILVKNKEEFLLVTTQDKNELCIRLDKITLLDN